PSRARAALGRARVDRRVRPVLGAELRLARAAAGPAEQTEQAGPLMATREEAPPGWAVLQVRRTFQAPREQVFRAWTDPELLRQWLHGYMGRSPHAEADVRVGGEFRITSTARGAKFISKVLRDKSGELVHMVGRYLEVSPPERLVFTMGWEDFPTVTMDPDAT